MKQQYTILMFACMLISSMSGVYAFETTVSLDDYEILFEYGIVEEGDTFTLTVTVNNTDDVARSNIEFRIEESGPFEVDGDRVWDIGTLAAGQSEKRNFRIEVDDDTEKGDYDLEIELQDSKDEYTDDVELEVLSTKADLIIGSVTSSPITILPDQEDVKLTVQLDNIGGGDATFLRAKLILPNGISASNSFSDTFTVGTIGADKGRELTFFIDTDEDIQPGTHTASLVLEYESDSRSRSARLNFEIPIKGGPQFEILHTEILTEELIAGGTGTISIRIRNTGSEDGEETSVRVFENADYPFDFDEKTNFVGTIPTNEEGIALFKVEIDTDADPKTYLLKTQIRTVNRGDVIVSEHSVPIRVTEEEQRSPLGNIAMIIGIIVLLLLLYVVYLLIVR